MSLPGPCSRTGGFALLGLNDSYTIEVEQLVRNSINHVEVWFKCSKEDFPKEDCHLTWQKMLDHGANINERYLPAKEGCWFQTKIDKDRAFDKHHRIECTAGTALPFDFNGGDYWDPLKIDLVVGSDHNEPDATEMLESFDLSICKSWWDGKFFHVCQPHLTFDYKAVLEPERRLLMQRYQESYPQSGPAAVHDMMDEELFQDNEVTEYLPPGREPYPSFAFIEQDVANHHNFMVRAVGSCRKCIRTTLLICLTFLLFNYRTFVYLAISASSLVAYKNTLRVALTFSMPLQELWTLNHRV